MKVVIFDYQSLGKKLAVPPEVIQKLEEAAGAEFLSDQMLMEIHILRAVKAYAKASIETVPIEN
jgi:hypothetical protein